jgi:hypothetical protein
MIWKQKIIRESITPMNVIKLIDKFHRYINVLNSESILCGLYKQFDCDSTMVC